MAGLTTVTSGGISDGTITNADINASAAIDASKVSGLSTDSITEGNTTVEVVDTGSDGHITFDTEGNERMRIDSAGRLGIGVTPSNFGTDRNSLELHSSSGTVTHLALTNNTTGGNGASNGFNIIQNGLNTLMYLRESGFMSFSTANTERMRIDSSGNVGIGTSSPSANLHIDYESNNPAVFTIENNEGSFKLSANANLGLLDADQHVFRNDAGTSEYARIDSSGNVGIGSTNPQGNLHIYKNSTDGTTLRIQNSEGTHEFKTNGGTLIIGGGTGDGTTTERMRIHSDGAIGMAMGNFANTSVNTNTGNGGTMVLASGNLQVAVANATPMHINRMGGDGTLLAFMQAGTLEGYISVSGTTVSYLGGHLARMSQTVETADPTVLLKGTVMTNLNEMCEWRNEDGNLEDNEQLNKMAVSSVEGDPNVAGVMVNIDEDGDLNVAMTGDMIIRIAQGTTVARGDLLMSAGDGTAKPQGDDIVRSKTIAKVTSTTVSTTYDDGSYCVPCVLMAC